MDQRSKRSLGVVGFDCPFMEKKSRMISVQEQNKKKTIELLNIPFLVISTIRWFFGREWRCK